MSGMVDSERPNSSVTSIFESMLFDSEERDQDGRIIKAKLLPNYFKICVSFCSLSLEIILDLVVGR